MQVPSFFFLFILGLFIVKSPLKNWAAGVIVLYIFWAWGKNFAAFNYLFYDYFPMFNKFRAVTMVLALVQLLMVFVAVLALNTIAKKEISWKDLQKPFLISLGITGGLSLILALMPTVFFSFQGISDQQSPLIFLSNDKDPGFWSANSKCNCSGPCRIDAQRCLPQFIFHSGNGRIDLALDER